MSLPIITPPEDQPLWALMQELEALGGIRHQDFKAVAGSPRWGYQVTPELYQKWLEAGGVDTSGEHDNPEPTTDLGADADTSADPAAQDAPDPGTADAEQGTGTEAPAQATTKAAAKTTTTAAKRARQN